MIDGNNQSAMMNASAANASVTFTNAEGVSYIGAASAIEAVAHMKNKEQLKHLRELLADRGLDTKGKMKALIGKNPCSCCSLISLSKSQLLILQ